MACFFVQFFSVTCVIVLYIAIMLNELTDFINYLRYEKRYAIHTLTAYQTDILQFSAYLKQTYNSDAIADIAHPIIRSWIVSMMDEGISPRSVNRKITTLKTFYRFMNRVGKITYNPMLKIQSPKQSKRLPLFVDKDKMEQLLTTDQIYFTNDYSGVRNKLIIEMFYCTGMRVSELVNLKVANVDLSSKIIKIIGKRNKERIIPLTNPLTVAMEKYEQHKSSFFTSNVDEEYYFLNDKGNPIYIRWVYTLVNRCLATVTTLEKRSPHVLRHTFATHLLNNGADLNAIKELLGHASLAATQIYTHNTIEKLKNVHKKAHPKS